MPRSTFAALVAVLLLAVCASPASAYRLPAQFGPILGNPVEHLADLAIDDEVYDRATHCNPSEHKGVEAMVRWLGRHAEGQFWGSYRCEKWGEREASLHAENRAIDWHLDADRPASRTAGKRLIKLLLAPDREGNAHALARRMGVEEIIWDCSYWGAGMEDFATYSVCFNKHGERRTHVNRTAAHIDHLHLGMSKAGAAGRTSFWRSALASR
jgi:hypothetical protein